IQFMDTVLIQRRTMSRVEMRAVFHDDDRRLYGIDGLPTAFQNGIAGLERPTEIVTGSSPLGLAEVELGHHAAASMDGKGEFRHGYSPLFMKRDTGRAGIPKSTVELTAWDGRPLPMCLRPSAVRRSPCRPWRPRRKD